MPTGVYQRTPKMRETQKQAQIKRFAKPVTETRKPATAKPNDAVYNACLEHAAKALAAHDLNTANTWMRIAAEL